jgi:hypothetical protein
MNKPVKAPPGLTLGARLRYLRESHTPYLSIDGLTRAVNNLRPPYMEVSRERVRRLEAGTPAEEDADPLLVLALAGALDCRVSDLSPLAADRLKFIRTQVVHMSACIRETAGAVA